MFTQTAPLVLPDRTVNR